MRRFSAPLKVSDTICSHSLCGALPEAVFVDKKYSCNPSAEPLAVTACGP
jgi:hypothetical protein